MKRPVKYLRISDKIISVSGEQKPIQNHEGFGGSVDQHAINIKAFDDSFIEVSNPDDLSPMLGHSGLSHVVGTLTEGTYPIKGLEFEVKCQAQDWNYLEGHPKYWREISLKEYEIDNSQSRRIALVSLSSTPDPVEPTANEGHIFSAEEVLRDSIIKNDPDGAYMQKHLEKYKKTLEYKVILEAMQSYASQERSKAISECITAIGLLLYDNEGIPLPAKRILDELSKLKDKT